MAIQDLKVSMAYSGRDISSLSDRPNQDGMSAASLKARFDQLNKEVIPNLNDLIDLLDVYIQTNDSDIVGLENSISELGISLDNLGLSVQDILNAYTSGLLSGVYIGTTEPTDPRIKVWINPSGDSIAIDEATRVAQEIVRQTNENIRISSETLRIENEIARNTFVNYSNSTQYQAGNKVAYQGSSYAAKSDTIGHLPTDTTYWLLIAQKGEQGEQGIQGIQGIQGVQGIQGLKGNQWKGAYSGSTSYVVDDVVSYNGSSYICILASLNNLPTNTTYFSLFAQKGDNTTASAVTNTPSGNISATTVQGAINELDTEKAPTVHTHDDRYYTETEVNTLLNAKANKTQEAWITPTLINLWVQQFTPPKYYKDEFGIVRLTGTITGGLAGTDAFILPVGYRPSTNLYLAARSSSGTFGTITITTGGNVNISNFNTWVSLDNVNFRI